MRLDTATVAPDTIEVVDRFKSAPDVPTDISTILVPPEVVKVAQVAVPVLPAVAEVIEFAVSTPDEAAGAKVELSASEASKVLPDNAVSGFVGCAPV